MKILQVGPIPPEVGGKTVGGVATHVWDLSTHLAKRGHEVAILADNFPNPTKIPVVKEGVEIYGFSKDFILKHLPSILLNRSAIYKLKKHFNGLINIKGIIRNFCYYKYVLSHFKPDIIHVHHLENRFPLAYFVAQKKSIPIITTVHSISSVEFESDPIRKEKNLKLIKRNARLAQNIIFGNSARMHKFLDLLDDKERENIRCWLIHYPLDSSLYYPISKYEARTKINKHLQKPLILFVARLDPVKGADTLVKAVSIFYQRDKNLSFDALIVGGGQQWEELRTMIAKYGLESHISLEGAKIYPDLLYYYNAADLFILPSKEEAIPYTALEAMLCGCPTIISTNVSKDLLPPAELIYQVPPDNPEALAEAIRLGLKRDWNTRGIVEYVCSFDWEYGTRANINAFEKLYMQLSNLINDENHRKNR